jgi:hypothetical protein
MAKRSQYRKRQPVIAVKLDLDMQDLKYRKWGGTQRAKGGDWLVDNDGDTYTVNAASFAGTYQRLRPGVYLKTTPIWAEIAAKAGSIRTKEGSSHYKSGDYLVYNHRNGRDGYCMTAKKFKSMYKLVR